MYSMFSPNTKLSTHSYALRTNTLPNQLELLRTVRTNNFTDKSFTSRVSALRHVHLTDFVAIDKNHKFIKT